MPKTIPQKTRAKRRRRTRKLDLPAQPAPSRDNSRTKKSKTKRAPWPWLPSSFADLVLGASLLMFVACGVYGFVLKDEPMSFAVSALILFVALGNAHAKRFSAEVGPAKFRMQKQERSKSNQESPARFPP